MLRLAVAHIDDLPAADAGAAPAWMCDDEKRRWAAGSTAARREFAAGRGLLRELLRAVTGIPLEGWLASAQAGAAPRVRARHAAAGDPRLHASVSHRLGWVAAAVADAAVGVDIECERPTRSDPRQRAELMLSPAELPTWRALDSTAREAALLTRWTIKEAWFKASPSGAAPWDFRQVVARAGLPAQANVRTWAAAPLHVALCCADGRALSDARCEGLEPDASTSSWFVHRIAAAD